MQIYQTTCPYCQDGRVEAKVCGICCGSGWVGISPMMRPVSSEASKAFQDLWNRPIEYAYPTTRISHAP